MCGIATDYCVKATALDAARNGFATTVLLDLTAAVDPANTDAVIDELTEAGVTTVTRRRVRAQGATMDVADLVRQHYGGVDLQAGILAGLTAAGVDVDHLTVDDLSAVDQLHAGFSDATRYLLGRLDLGPDTRLLDVGCGIGGPARLAAAEHGCRVTGVDLSPGFVATARSLTARVGLTDRVDFRVAEWRGSRRR